MKQYCIQRKLKGNIYVYERARSGNEYVIMDLKVKKFGFYHKSVKIIFPGSLARYIAGIVSLSSTLLIRQDCKIPQNKSFIMRIFQNEYYYATSIHPRFMLKDTF